MQKKQIMTLKSTADSIVTAKKEKELEVFTPNGLILPMY